MDHFCHPSVHIIAESNVQDAELERVLAALDVDNWEAPSNDAECIVEFAGKLCYMSFDKKLNRNLTKVGTRSTAKYIQEGIIAHHHGSVLEHGTVTILLRNVSRIVTHELVRHRAGTAYSQVSGRYVRVHQPQYFLPSVIAEDYEATKLFARTIDYVHEQMRELGRILKIDEQTDFDLKKKLTSAIRRLQGEGAATHIIVTANHRAWRHMIEMRTSPGAEEEIQVVFRAIAELLKGRYGAIYGDMELQPGHEVTFRHSKV
jgi:thymidylate synthase (FAD)